MTYIGACFILLASTYIGFEKSNMYIQRTRQIKEMIYCLHVIEAEIVYNHINLQETFDIVSKKSSGPLSEFFKQLSFALKNPVANVQVLWQKESEKLAQLHILHAEELTIWNQFGFTIGDYTSENQQQQIQLSKQYLQEALQQATEDRQIYSKLYKTAGFLIGLFLIILLV